MDATIRDRPVVVVDDNPDDLTLTTMLLRKVAGVRQLLTLNSPEATIDYLSNVDPSAAEFPRTLVLDVKMPGFTGLDLLEWVRGHPIFDSVSVVMWSSSDDARDVERAASLGAQCYVGKYPPVDIVEDMFRAVDKFSDRTREPRFFPTRGNLLLGDTMPR